MPSVESIRVRTTSMPGWVLKALRNAMPSATDEEIAMRLARDVAEYFARKNGLAVAAYPDATIQTALGKFVCGVPVRNCVRYVEIDSAEWPWKATIL